jgi:hypothetical protein
MAKTQFVNGSIILPAWINSIFGSGAAGGHVHDGADSDGHCPKVNLASAAEVTGALPLANVAAIGSDDVTNQTYIPGADVSTVLESLSSSIGGLGSDDISNDSTVSGLDVSSALNTLAGLISGIGDYTSLGLVPGNVALTGATGTAAISSAYYCLSGDKIHLDAVLVITLTGGTLTQIAITLPDVAKCVARYVGYNGMQFLANNTSGIGPQSIHCTAGFYTVNNVLCVSRSVTARDAFVPFLDDGTGVLKISISIDYERLIP